MQKNIVLRIISKILITYKKVLLLFLINVIIDTKKIYIFT